MHISPHCLPRLSLNTMGHSILKSILCQGMCGVDATAGNGHDTLFLAELLGPQGHVWAFDVQESALTATKNRLETQSLSPKAPITYVHASHEHMAQYVPQGIHVIVFNLGYLPGSDKTCTTKTASSLLAIQAAQSLLVPGGIIWLHGYTGHAGGDEECQSLIQYTKHLPYEQWHILHTQTHNKALRPEHILLLQKR